MIISGKPAGSARPIDDSTYPGDSIAGPSNRPESFKCGYPGCTREFPTKRGVGAHERQGHPNWRDEQLAQVRHIKAPWSEEEESLLARREAELTLLKTRFMNQALAEVVNGRSYDAIKSRRKNKAYQDKVKRCLGELRSPLVSGDVDEDRQQIAIQPSVHQERDVFLDVPVNEQLLIRIEEPLIAAPELQSGRLMAICRRVRNVSSNRSFEEVTNYLEDVFRRPVASPPGRSVDSQVGVMSKRKIKAEKYAKTQDLWRKNPSCCVDWIMKEEEAVVDPPSKELMVPFWECIMTGGEVGIKPEDEDLRPPIQALWEPITMHEIKRCLPGRRTASGPDGLKAKELRRMPLAVLQRIFHLFMYIGKIPKYLLESYTSLIPKKGRALAPGDFRPITVSSVLLRAFHKVLALRVLKHIKIDNKQRAFLQTDGCAQNIFLLDIALKYHQQKHKPLFMASVDVAKAFDSISHSALLQTLKIKGFPPAMVSYLEEIYNNSFTRLKCGNWRSDPIRPTRGVKQGDPLSPMMFILTIDRMLAKLPREIGCTIGDVCVNGAASADDIILFASTSQGLQKQLDVATNFLGKCGLAINANKSLTVSLRSVPHLKKTVVDAKSKFNVSNVPIPALERTDTWTYLGVPFSPEGRVACDPSKIFSAKLEKLSKASLKPQQRLFALKVFIMPSILHLLTLGATYTGTMNKLDKLVRSYVKRWLKLPHDVPNAYIHASIDDGGLGMTSFRWSIPMLRLKRLQNLPLSPEGTATTPGGFLEKEQIKAKQRAWDGSKYILTKKDLWYKMANALYSAVDGVALKESRKVERQHAWISAPTKFLSGRDYISACKCRINALPTRSRTTRGRRHDRLCRAGCLQPETQNHIMQQCHRTHRIRIRRHDALVKYVGRSLYREGYQVCYEPKLRTEEGLRKPDIVATLGETAVIVDAQVVSEQSDLKRAHKVKRDYYAKNKDVEHEIIKQWGVRNTIFSTVTLSCRGLWSQQSAKELLDLGIIKKKDIPILSTRAIMGGVAAWNIFNRTTTTILGGQPETERRGIRTGIG